MQHTKKIALAACMAAALNVASAQLVSEAWIDRFDGPVNDDDFMSDITVDSLGNVYVVGATRELVPPNSLYPRFLTVKYAPDGTQQWFRTHKGGFPNLDASFAYSVVVDGNDDVVVAGSVTNSSDWGLVKYDAAGNVLWSRVYALGSISNTNPSQVVVDGADNVYMTGYYANTATTVKYDANGVFQWDLSYSGGGSAATSAAIVADAVGNTYVVGTTTVSGLSGELGVHKIDPSGNVEWFHTSGYPGFSSDRAMAVAIDPATGAVVVGGHYGANTALGPDFAALKFAPNGTLIWQRFWDGAAGRSDYVSSMALDGQGAVVLAGYSQTASFDYDAVAVKFDANGVFQWSNVYAGSALFSDYGFDVAVDGADNVVMVGDMTPLTGGNHYFTVCYDAAGAQLWEKTYGGPLNGNSAAWGVAISGGDVYVSGESDSFTFDVDLTTIKYVSAPAQSYCTAQVNSQGCAPYAGYAGTPSATAGSGFDITVDDLLNNKNGILFYSVNGANNAPFGGGTMCALAPTRRTPLQGTGGNPLPEDCSGTIVYDFNAWIALGKDPSLVAGQQVWAQFWSRDPKAVGTSTNLSDALTFVIGN